MVQAPPARHSTLGKKRWKSGEIYSRVERSGVGAGKVRRCEASRQRRQAGGREDTLQAAVGGWGCGVGGNAEQRRTAVLMSLCEARKRKKTEAGLLFLWVATDFAESAGKHRLR